MGADDDVYIARVKVAIEGGNGFGFFVVGVKTGDFGGGEKFV